MAFAHLTLATRDVEATGRFFEETLGWRPIARPNNIPTAAAWLAIGDGQELHLVKVEDFEPSPFEREFGRHLAVGHPKNDLEGLKSRLAKAGAQVIEALRPTPFARFFFRDPNGYMFEVVDDARSPETDESVRGRVGSN